MNRHYALEKVFALGPCAFGEVRQPVYLGNLQGREGARETRGCACSEYKLQRIGEIGPANLRGAALEGDRHPMLGILDHRWAVETQQFEIAVEIGRRDIEAERVTRRK